MSTERMSHTQDMTTTINRYISLDHHGTLVWGIQCTRITYAQYCQTYMRTRRVPVNCNNGTLWPVQDYRKINKWMIQDVYPIPQITHILEQLQGKMLFTALDIRWGYNNIQIKPEDHHKAAFQTPYGLYQPNVMYFSLTNLPLTFQKMMDRLFHLLKDKYLGMLFIYMDNILITTTNDLPLH
jgi:Reverse transcriptase (RNA-dependent DNA polymerase)